MNTSSTKYKILSKIDEGSYGEVYLCKNILTKERFAVKISSKKFTLKHEYNIYKKLQQNKENITNYNTGICKLYSRLGYFDNFGGLGFVLELLDRNLKFYKKKYEFFSEKTVLMLGYLIIDLLECIHNKGIVHCDLKPSNFMFKGKVLYLIDFGMAQFINENKEYDSIGNMKFNSINAHLNKKITIRDELESFFYILVYLLNGRLPWCKLNSNNKNRDILEMKKSINVDAFLEGLNCKYKELFLYIKSSIKIEHSYIKRFF